MAEAFGRRERVAVHMADRWLDLTEHRPRDQAVLLELLDLDGDVVLAQLRKVVQRLAIHVHDEAVTDAAHRIAVGILEHPGRIDRHVALRVAQHGEYVRRRCGDGAGSLDAFGHNSSRLTSGATIRSLAPRGRRQKRANAVS